ncbi:hypothetical protein [Allocoleopsis franciscana]|uniref:Glycerophosphoryl diester phosphodiesterase membrane domain-containing protein n=1 Tax=Allocoleopsis franciscana PCC 7113 TaxID=1173027 RepID=K9WFS9_9CYAN|nr:hypothetical protein [Allocoleopsis franciscana]AFZ18614.1 hypothetical protein Mic7113_2831 [Allocoleopsis franciscana PCC 7113]
MSENLNSPPLIQPLSIGNVVNVTINLYRANLQLYLKVSLLAYLWLLVPVYGWAKFLVNSALISRLAFCELMSQTESIKDARRYIKPRTWSFLLAAILLSVLLLLTLIISFILTGLFLAMTRMEQVMASFDPIADEVFVRNNILSAIFFLIILLLILLVFLACLFAPTLWLYSRFFISEVPLASETNINLITTLCRSWKLTKGYFWKIQIIIIVSFFLFLPLEILLYLGVELINFTTSRLMADLISSYPLMDSILVEMFSWAITLLNAVILLPFFQVIKAVIYYNLRLRREGLGLRLRPSVPYVSTDIT